jgi:hypothetical protein
MLMPNVNNKEEKEKRNTTTTNQQLRPHQTPPGKKNKNGQAPMTRLYFFQNFLFLSFFPFAK